MPVLAVKYLECMTGSEQRKKINLMEVGKSAMNERVDAKLLNENLQLGLNECVVGSFVFDILAARPPRSAKSRPSELREYSH